jgi:hypothetical protein
MPPARRTLKPTLSNANELSAFQLSLLGDVTKLEEEAASTKTALYLVAKQYQVARSAADAVLLDLLSVRQNLTGCTEQEGIAWAKALLIAKEPKMLGMHKTCVVQWRFDEPSLWRGPPDNARLARFCRSIISSGFRMDQSIAARSLDMSANTKEGLVLFKLLFGDGSARGISALIVWTLIVRRSSELTPDAGVTDIVESLWALPTSFEEHGDGSERAALIAQAARQNQAAQVLPVSTIEWIGMVKDWAGMEIGASISSRAAMSKKLEEIMDAYNAHPDVESYSEAPAKRQRTKKGAKAIEGPDEGFDKGLKVGVRKLTAMRNFLQGGTQTGYDLLRQHLLWVSDYRVCVVSDDIMMKPWFWVTSPPPKEQLPEVMEVVAREAGAKCPETLVPRGFAHALLQYDTRLSALQFELMLTKAITIFEGETAHLTREDQKIKAKPQEET